MHWKHLALLQSVKKNVSLVHSKLMKWQRVYIGCQNMRTQANKSDGEREDLVPEGRHVVGQLLSKHHHQPAGAHEIMQLQLNKMVCGVS